MRVGDLPTRAGELPTRTGRLATDVDTPANLVERRATDAGSRSYTVGFAMPWSIIVSGVAGGLAGAVSALVKGENAKLTRIVVMVVLFFTFNFIGQRYVAKPLIVDAQLRDVPAFTAIKEHEPATYQTMKSELVTAMQDGANTDAIRLRVHNLTASLVQKYIPRCSDEALIRYMKVTMDEVDQLAKRNPEAAFAMLFPEPGKFVDIRSSLDDATQKEDLAALAGVISSGAGKPVHPAAGSRGSELVTQAFQELASEEGGDAVKQIANPRAPGVDKHQVCVLVSRLYRKILALPEDDAALALRTMLAPS